MKKFNKIITNTLTVALVSALTFGFGFKTELKADEANTGAINEVSDDVNVITSNWTTVKGFPDENTGEVSTDVNINPPALLDSVITTTPDRIDANIGSTGWAAQWWQAQGSKPSWLSPALMLPDPSNVTEGSFCGDNPFQLESKNTVYVVPGNTYRLSFTVQNGMFSTKSTNTGLEYTDQQKNIFLRVGSGIQGDYDNYFRKAIVKLDPQETKTFSYDVTIPSIYRRNTVEISFAYGAFSASYAATQLVNKGELSAEQVEADGTIYAYPCDEPTAVGGTLIISNIAMIGKKSPVAPTTPATPTTVSPSVPTTAVVAQPTTPKVLAQVKGVKAKNNKKGKVTVTWKKVAHAKKYQVKVAKKTFTVSKTKYVAKVKKGQTVKIQVRAAVVNGYQAGKWSKAISVKIKK